MEKYVCKDCIGDDAVGDFISKDAVSSHCDYCDRVVELESIAASLSDVARFIAEGFYAEWSNPDDESIPWDSEDGRYMVPTSDTYDLLERYLELEDELRDDLISNLPDHDWCQANPLRLGKDEEWDSEWEEFSEQLKHETRYVFYRAEPEERDSYNELRTPYEILETIEEFVREYDLVRTLAAGTVIVRARPHKKDEEYSQVEDLGPPPKEKAKYSNRMSPAGIPMFYGSDLESTTLTEIEENDFATVAEFKTLKEFKILDLNRIPELPSLFDQQLNHQRPAIRFLHHFLSDVAKHVEKDGREHIEYVPTQVVTEYFRRVFRDADGEPVRGIIYPSSRHEGGKSYVLFFVSENCTQDDDDENTSDEKWLSMNTALVRRVGLRRRTQPPPVGKLF